MVKILARTPLRSSMKIRRVSSVRNRHRRRRRTRKRDSMVLQNFVINENIPTISRNDQTNVHTVNENVAYVLIKDLKCSYQLQSDLCCKITLVPLTPKWLLYCDGYVADHQESLAVSTCFSHKTFIELLDERTLSGKTKNRKFSLVNLEEIDSNPFSEYEKQSLLKGKFVLLKLETDWNAFNKYKMTLEYVSKISTDFFSKICKRKLASQMLVSSTTMTKTAPEETWLIRKIEQIYSFIDGVRTGDIILICGPSNCGKTTLTHHLINKYLSINRKCAYYLECDPGQTTFSPCGILSLIKIQEKISNALGHEFLFKENILLTQSNRIESKILGAISPSSNSSDYISLIEKLFESFKKMNTKQPLFINTMGWVEQLGLKLLIEIIKITRPTHVIRIENDTVDENLCDRFITRTIGKYSQLPDLRELFELKDHFRFHLLVTSFSKTSLFNLTPYSSSHVRREILQSLYMISNLWPKILYKPFFSIEPIKISLSNSYIYLANHSSSVPKSIYDLLNVQWIFYGNVDPSEDSLKYVTLFPETGNVAIGYVDGGIKLLQQIPSKSGKCYGCGIIRNVDAVSSTIMITMSSNMMTQKPLLNPETINYIVLPNQISIPSGFLTEQFIYQDSCSLPYTYSISNTD